MPTIEERLLAKLDRSGDCWLFTGCTDPAGYGIMWDGRQRNNSRAHRLAYEFWVGPIPEGLDIHHRCQVRQCCRPDHLEAMDPAEHNGMHHRRTHCQKGHPFTGVVYRGQQICRVCSREYARKYTDANRDRINERKRQRRRAAKARRA